MNADRLRTALFIVLALFILMLSTVPYAVRAAMLAFALLLFWMSNPPLWMKPYIAGFGAWSIVGLSTVAIVGITYSTVLSLAAGVVAWYLVNRKQTMSGRP